MYGAWICPGENEGDVRHLLLGAAKPQPRNNIVSNVSSSALLSSSVDFNRQARLAHGTISDGPMAPTSSSAGRRLYSSRITHREREGTRVLARPAELRRLGVVGATTNEAEYMLKPTPSPSSRAVSSLFTGMRDQSTQPEPQDG